MAEHEVELPNPEEIEEQRSKLFTRRIALVTAVYAVFLAIVSLGGNNASKELSLSQQQASDQWPSTSPRRCASTSITSRP